MTRFQQAVPKFFASSGTRVIRDHASFFNKIHTWAEWDHQHTGFRDFLKSGLAAFATSHREAIHTTFGEDPTSNAYDVAILSLNESVSIIEAWITFSDDYVKSLTLAKFNYKKAFHVTTMLVLRLIVANFEPRAGVLKTCKAGNMDQTSNAAFWSTLQSLDITLEIKQIGFANHPLVAAELVRCLTVNSGIEVAEQLELRIQEFETKLTTAQKSLTSAEKAATSASNKADEAKKANKALAKRVAKLE
jgi:hypothetical protein